MRESELTYLTSLRTLATSDSEPRSSFKIVGGFARVNPVPTTSHPFRSNALTTCLPSRPVAPVTSAIFAIVGEAEVVQVPFRESSVDQPNRGFLDASLNLLHSQEVKSTANSLIIK